MMNEHSANSTTATAGTAPVPTAKLGSLEPAGDRWRLRFTRRLPHPPEKVWRALIEPEHQRAWFPATIVVEGNQWAAGERLRFIARETEFEGQVLAYTPPTTLEFTWGTDTLRIEVAAADGGSILTLLDTFGEYGKAARDAAGWHECLDNLEYELDGAEPPLAPGQRWRQVNPVYAERFGPEAATIGPPADQEA
jgi:uncharacterized protein YndB with AHSA1/START domain